MTLISLLLVSLIGCSKTVPTAKQPKAIRVWWGTKEQIVSFLETPEAQSERWIVEAIGDK